LLRPRPRSRRRLHRDGHLALRRHPDLGALPTAVASARMHAHAMVTEWALDDIAEDISHVVNRELVTNAVRASTGEDGRRSTRTRAPAFPVVHLRLQSNHRRVIVEVRDLSTALPAAKQPDPDAEGGRGLLLVEALTERWGWEHNPNWPGKVVWAELVSKTRSRVNRPLFQPHRRAP
jgi:Histidine kinase-like ATPase domain